jgi:hypothetical protein
MGLGNKVLKPSVLQFYGVETQDGRASLLEKRALKQRKIEFIGASDTAGYCVDGTPAMGAIKTGLDGWKYDNCDKANPGLTGNALDAEISV